VTEKMLKCLELLRPEHERDRQYLEKLLRYCRVVDIAAERGMKSDILDYWKGKLHKILKQYR